MTFKKPKWIRRIGAALLDFICAILLMLILSFATTPIVNKIFNGDELKKEYYSYAIATKLYTYDENNNIQIIYDVKTFDVKAYVNKLKESQGINTSPIGAGPGMQMPNPFMGQPMGGMMPGGMRPAAAPTPSAAPKFTPITALEYKLCAVSSPTCIL